ncbi:MAG TPA: 30S ribosomal protein S19e [Candidatus Thermoplasmatota archaeon]|nr:30S ribosomal protein S19e [Candidatus Thermoplasmatota archaeon]
MTTVQDVPAEPLIRNAAGKLKAIPSVKAPEWSAFVTTGIHREKPPVDKEWWHTRVAAVLRKVYLEGPIGTERLRAHFGGARDRGAKPNRAKAGSGSIAREALQQLEAAGLVENVKGEGRRVTAKGRSFMDNAAYEAKKELVATIPGLEKY